MPEPRKKAVVRHPIGTNGSALNFVVCCYLFCVWYICYIVFDDYGLSQYEHHVHKAVNQAMNMGALTFIKGIGHEEGFNFRGEPPRILHNHEGLITKINFNVMR